MTAKPPFTVLGIETSCDDTAAALIQGHAGAPVRVLANEVWAQHADHQSYGGVVPEIAARSHVERLDGLIQRTMEKAGLGFSDIDAVAATAGPGLIGGVLVGLTTAKAICMSHNIALIPVNHLEGHALSVRITDNAPFPYLLLLVSGGHTQLIKVRGLGDYQRLGTTIDDAAGEAFDKTAKLLGLGQPGGPRVESAATGGRSDRFVLPHPLKGRAGCDFSFSGLKTAIRLAAEAIDTPTGQDVADLSASFQFAAARHLSDRTAAAISLLNKEGGYHRLVVAGGVAANCAIKTSLSNLCDKQGWTMIVPPAKYCTDNGAMIAQAGLERLAAKKIPPLDQVLAMAPRARWPLATVPADAIVYGGGKKGPKA